MKLTLNVLTIATLAALSSQAKAEIFIDQIGGSEVSFEGLVQMDANYFSDDIAKLGADSSIFNGGDGLDKDFAMRRAELVMKGKGPGMWNWVVGYDANSQTWLDVNVQYKFSGNTTLYVGQFKQYNSMEELSSTKSNDFIAKAMTTNLQGIARRLGVGMVTGGDKWTVSGSVFDHNIKRNTTKGQGFGVRGAYAPINSNGNLLHLGLSYNQHDIEDTLGAGNYILAVRPDADLAATTLIGTGIMANSESVSHAGVEAAFVKGPFKLQSEYMATTVNRKTTPDFSGDSWYVYGLWNITGETWGYKQGVITTPLPNEPATGMWQLGVRYDTADLNDGSVNFANPLAPIATGVLGGTESNLTVGVNWYLRSNFKLAANYVKVMDHEKYSSSVKNFISDEPSIFEVRAQLYW